MDRKYFVHLIHGRTVALKFKQGIKRVIVGGYGAAFNDLKFIANDAFGVPEPEVVWTQRNKVRMIFTMEEERFDEGMTYLIGLGHSLEQVKSHGRLMR